MPEPVQDPQQQQSTQQVEQQAEQQAQSTQPAQQTQQSQELTQQSAQQTQQGQQLDKDALRKEISDGVSDSVSKSVIQKIGDALGLTKKEEEALPSDKKSLEALVDQKFQEKMTAYSQEQQQEQEKSKQEYNEKVKGVVTGWRSQYNELARLGKVPPIKDYNNKDEAKVWRNVMLGIDKIIKDGKAQDPSYSYVPTVSDVLLRYPTIAKGAPGADLPISGNTGAMESTKDFEYGEIANSSFEKIARS